MEPRVMRVRWDLDEDGGGEAWVTWDLRYAVEDRKYVFDSLDDGKIPVWLAGVIREAGTIEGELGPEVEE